MSIKATLTQGLTQAMKDAGQTIPKTLRYKCLTDKQAVSFIAATGTPVSPAAIFAVLSNLDEYLLKILQTGQGVRFGSLLFCPSVTGVVNADGTSPAGQELKVRMGVRVAPAFQRQLAATCVGGIEMVTKGYTQPEVVTFFDAASAATNTTLTPGGVASITTQRAKFNPSKSDEGLFLVPLDSANAVVKVSVFLTNKPSKLAFQIPTGLEPGAQYSVVLRNRVPGSQVLREGRLMQPLTVA